MKHSRTLLLVLAVLLAVSGLASSQSWTPLTHQPTFNASTPLLLTDGTVIAHPTSSRNWWKLTPDINGSYVNGTWTQIASLPAGYAPLDFGSAVLPDGRVIIEGGEYNNGTAVWTNLGAIYDPIANTWTAVNPPNFFVMIGDAEGTLLPDGTYLQTDCCDVPPQAAKFNEAAFLSNPTQDPNNYWSFTGAGKFDVYDEEGLTKLPNGNILTVDAYVFQYDANGTNSEIYNTATGTWSSAGSTGVQLWDSYPNQNNASYEVGPASLRPDGTVFATGANGGGAGHTSVYDTHTGLWTPGPDFPSNLDIADGPACLLPSGNVLVDTSPGIFQTGVQFFEWDGSTLTSVPGTPRSTRESSYYNNMVMLPTGQVMMTDVGRFVYLYNSLGNPNPAWAPQILLSGSQTTNYVRGNSYMLYGNRFSGMAMGCTYGDDESEDSNYPIVRFTNNATGHVFFGRTTFTSSYGVQVSGPMSTHLQIPASMETGPAQMVVIVNGIPSAPVVVNIQ